MRLDDLHLWFLGDPAEPRYVGALKLVAAGKGVSLHYGQEWLAKGFALSEDLPLIDTEFLPQGRLLMDAPHAVGAVAQQIDGDYLLAQRTGFSPEQFDKPAFKKPRKAPFK